MDKRHGIILVQEGCTRAIFWPIYLNNEVSEDLLCASSLQIEELDELIVGKTLFRKNLEAGRHRATIR
jgi:hypothetical protein